MLLFGITFLLYVTVSSCQNESDLQTNSTVQSEQDIYGNEVNCVKKPCVRKCCPLGQYVEITYQEENEGGQVLYACNNFSTKPEDFDCNVFDENRRQISKKGRDVFNFITGTNVFNDSDTIFMDSAANLFVLENGNMTVEIPNIYDRLTTLDFNHYCLDYIIADHVEKGLSGMIILSSQPEEPDKPQAITGMFLSSVFLVLTLAVYSFLPQLRNLHGKVLMAYCVSLLATYLSNGILAAVSSADMLMAEFCHIIAMICYYSIISTFFWMNVMSFDIWWTFRGLAKVRDINRRGENHKFYMYCLYGFGCPLAMTVIFAVINYLPMDKINPAIVTPGIVEKGCFIIGYERKFWLYAPMLVLILANCILFTATILNLCAVRRATRTLRAVAAADRKRLNQKSAQNRFVLYVKVFILMGVSWVWEAVSGEYPELNALWEVTDLFNLLSGVFIFIIFVFKRKVLKLLRNRYRQIRDRSQSQSQSRLSRSRSSSTSSSVVNEISQLEPIVLNPKGRSNIVDTD